MRRATAVILAAVLLAACSSLGERQSLGPNLAREAGWSWGIVDGGAFKLAAATAPLKPASDLVVYLEGDGLAYVRPSQPAQDPTPTDPLALRLALAHPAGNANVVWLGRPCQYVTSPRCERAYWTSRRYTPEILDSIAAALDEVKSRSHANAVTLVGYSGGGAIAVLLAARRNDVKRVVTVAANLDLDYWTRRDGLSPLSGSLNPADVAPTLATLPQMHFTAGKDDTVGTDVVRSYLRHLPAGTPARLVEVPDYTHTCCWARDWGQLVRSLDW